MSEQNVRKVENVFGHLGQEIVRCQSVSEECQNKSDT